jgi:hypothetical protein
MQNANIQQANRATQFNELAALLGLNQVAQPGLQNFFAPGNADVVSGFAMQQQTANQNAQRSADMKGGMMDAATSFIPSDRRLKKNIVKLGEWDDINVYEFEYLWSDEKQVGVMSDEIPQEYVVKGEDGYDRVDYKRLVTCS